MEVTWTILNALIGVLFGMLGGFLINRRVARLHGPSPSEAVDRGPSRLAPPKDEPEQPDWEPRFALAREQLLSLQRAQIEELRGDLRRADAKWGSELERLERLITKGQAAEPGSRAAAGNRARSPTPPLGFLALEVNGLRKEFPIAASTRMTLGRGSGNDIVLQDMRLSETHVAFRSDERRAFVEPLGAAQPVLLNERRLAKPTELQGGDVLTFGGNSRVTFSERKS